MLFQVQAFTNYTVEADSPEQAEQFYNDAIVESVGFPLWDVDSDGLTITDVNAEEASPSMADLMSAVRAHPDFVFGTVFAPGDFPNGEVPDEFNSGVATDRITEVGNEMISDL